MMQGFDHLQSKGVNRRFCEVWHCAVEVEGGKVPTRDWRLKRQILTSEGFQ